MGVGGGIGADTDAGAFVDADVDDIDEERGLEVDVDEGRDGGRGVSGVLFL